MRIPSPVRTLLIAVVSVTVLGVGSIAPAAAGAASARTATKTTLAAVHPLVGVRTTLTATVSPKPTGGTVRFSANGASIASCTAAPVKASTGKATCTTTFTTSGARTVTAAYSGRSPYTASTGKATVTVTAATGKIVGGVGACTTSSGALVAVSFAPWSGPIVRGCDPNPTTGIKLLTTAGFTTVGDQHDGPAFICRIAHPVFNSGTQYPTPSQDACLTTPPASALWTYWLGQPGANSWTYSPSGAYSDKPKAGEVEAWVYGASTTQPTFTPNQVRTQAAAGAVPATSVDTTSAPAASVAPAAGKRVVQRPAPDAIGKAATPGAHPRALPAGRASATAAGPDLAAAVEYLTGPANLTGGSHYEPFLPGYPDIGLTVDGAFALAATGTADPILAKITDYVAAHTDSWTLVGTKYADGGAIGKEAVLAEVTGNDPRAFGGHDLIAALDDLVCTNSTTAGCAGAGNYLYAQSVFSQSLGIIAQLRAGDAADAAKPIAYLEGLQNVDGSFPSVIPGSGADVDSTAMAAMALDLLTDDATARAGVDRALAWISAQQGKDGGFPGAAGNSTNSAALAVQGLQLAGSTYDAQIAAAVTFLAGQQNTDGGFSVSAGGQDGSEVRASAQVVGGVVGTSFGTLFDDITAVVAAPPTQSPTTAPISSTPRSAGTTLSTTPATTPAETAPSGTAADPSVAVAADPAPLADTGAHSATLIGVAALLLTAGLLLWFAGRRPRAAMVAHRHRGRKR